MALKLLMAVSRDGFLAKGPDDDMKWTGPVDKALFRVLTLAKPILLAGNQTARMMPPLKGRTVMPLSRNARDGVTLENAARIYPDAWLIGGPTVAKEALRLGLVDFAYLSWVDTPIRAGVHWLSVFGEYIPDLNYGPRETLAIGHSVQLQVFEVKRGA